MAEYGEIVWPALNAAELFTGCGGLALGLERAGFRHSFFAESDESCREILRRRFPGVPIVEDVRDVGTDLPVADTGGERRRQESGPAPDADGGGLTQLTERDSRAQRGVEAPQRDDSLGRDTTLDLLAGGFPCQPFSAAGKRKGEQDDRYLWPEFARAIRVLRPRAVLLENVPGILSMALDSGEPVFGRVLADLAEAGYDAEWFCLRASELGAPHRRERVFVVAHSTDIGHDGSRRARDGRARLEDGGGDAPDTPRNPRRIGDGDGGVREGYEVVEGWGPEQSSGPGADSSVAWGIYEPAIRRWEARTRSAPRPTDDRGRLDPRFPEWMLGFPEGWVEGVSRTAQLRMLGNAVQVQVAEVVGAAVYRSLLERKAA